MHLGGVTIKLPFVSFSVATEDTEKEVAREILIRLTDKRVLNSKECCDNCIDNSLASLQEIRKVIVDKQVQLSSYHDGGLYLLLEFIVEGIRQLITLEEKQKSGSNQRGEFYRDPDIRQEYFEALEVLRFHIHSCLQQIAVLAEMPTPKTESYLRSNEDWQLEFYIKPGDKAIESKA